MRKTFTTSLILLATTLAGTASAASVTWTVKKPAVRAQITGGPWVLAEGDAAAPTGGYPTPNPGTSSFQPYYQSFVTGANDQTIQGYFDYRPYKLEEGIVAATSSDFGRTWQWQQTALDFAPSRDDAAAKATDVANGHPFVAKVNGKVYLYNLDRTDGYVGHDELIVHEITAPTSAAPLNGVPARAEELGATAPKTKGLTRPDGIVAVLPSASQVTTFMYLEKQLATADSGVDAGLVMCADAAAAVDRTQLHLVDTTDGINFTNDRLVGGILEGGANGVSVGPRGTIHKYADGTYGFFFSAGTLDECEDSDAFHYIGYAESTDLLTWKVVNGLTNPLISTRDTDKEAWYAGRTYAPNVIFSEDGCRATMVFSGYATVSPKASLTDYRQIGVVTLTRACDAADAGPDAASPPDAATTPDGSTSRDASVTGADSGSGNGDTGGGGTGSDCAYAPAAAGGGAAWVAVGGVALMIARRRRRAR